jgi:hypothetical protein
VNRHRFALVCAITICTQCGNHPMSMFWGDCFLCELPLSSVYLRFRFLKCLFDIRSIQRPAGIIDKNFISKKPIKTANFGTSSS